MAAAHPHTSRRRLSSRVELGSAGLGVGRGRGFCTWLQKLAFLPVQPKVRWCRGMVPWEWPGSSFVFIRVGGRPENRVGVLRSLPFRAVALGELRLVRSPLLSTHTRGGGGA